MSLLTAHFAWNCPCRPASSISQQWGSKPKESSPSTQPDWQASVLVEFLGRIAQDSGELTCALGLPEMVGRGSGEGGQQVSGKRKRRIENKKVNEKGGTVAAALSLRACLYT